MIEHVVQFYDRDAYMLDQVADFVRAGIRAGDVAAVCVTDAHRAELEIRLRAEVSRAAGRRQTYLVLDAEESLAKIMTHGWPDERRFVELLEPALERAAQRGGRPLRLFGEMVSLLSANRQHDAAICLEEFGNNLATIHPVSIFCAYPIGVFPRAADGDAFLRICNAHSRVSPAESYAPPANAHEHYRAIAMLQQKAIALETETAHREELEKALLGR
jgi:MEDS: MEthanogen/methylotroph, DcmR Sensory domain